MATPQHKTSPIDAPHKLGGMAAAYTDVPLSAAQREILQSWGGQPAAPAPQSPQDAFSTGKSWDLAFWIAGGGAMAAGLVLTFFFAAFGAVMLLLGGLVCVVAYEHALVDEAGQTVQDFTAAPEVGDPSRRAAEKTTAAL